MDNTLPPSKLIEKTAKQVLGPDYKKKLKKMGKEEEKGVESRRHKKKADMLRIKKLLKKAKEKGDKKEYEKLLKEELGKYRDTFIVT